MSKGCTLLLAHSKLMHALSAVIWYFLEQQYRSHGAAYTLSVLLCSRNAQELKMEHGVCTCITYCDDFSCYNAALTINSALLHATLNILLNFITIISSQTLMGEHCKHVGRFIVLGMPHTTSAAFYYKIF